MRFVKPEQSDPSRDRGIQVPYAPGKRQLARWRWYLILLVVSSPLLYFVGKFLWASVAVEAPGVIAQEQITVRTLGQGYVEEVYVKPYEEVAEGDPLVRLNNPELEVRASQIRAELKALQGIPSSISAERGPTVNLQDQIEIAREQKSYQSQRMNSLQQLVDEGAATEAELSAARREEQQASSRISELYQTMAVQNHVPPSVPNTELRTRVLSLRAEQAKLEEQLEGQLVRAPRDGRIVDLAVVSGDQLALGGKVAMLAPVGGELHIDTYVPPKYAEVARSGQRGTVVFPDGSRREAEVASVPEVAREMPAGYSQPFGGNPVGVLVRMRFVDGEVMHGRISNGLPIRVRFENDWEGARLPKQIVARLDSAFGALRERFTTESSPQQQSVKSKEAL
ncbi:HlyD family secretion protein [Solimonas sp. K1W22B-7]|uniref:HlyD family secretion protein n=1 Tax=Solimonas sp. K1W22B-7 TaxID=2303331 RepID=UPI0013C4A9E5|nr:HlyD family efflux transporter periplasmic adaptor subunit [Solimonas sp. K1W22B-7]